VIDLHTHTTASDGRSTPAELVARASASGVTVLGVTDHDTVAGCDAAAAACGTAGITFVPGIEITALRDGLDVHVLGYFVDTASPPLHAFLSEQRKRRLARVRAMLDRLAALGMPLDADRILKPGIDDPSKAVGRPALARALVAAGHAMSTNDAFARWLSRGQPAFVPRDAAPPAEVISRIHDAGGIASLAHPGVLERDAWIREFAGAGLDALEAYHSDHDASTIERYCRIAADLGLAVSGGSDFHADEVHGPAAPGATSLPRHYYEALERKARTQRGG
jgi:hypothetical protein